jgi:hypothetical protein
LPGKDRLGRFFRYLYLERPIDSGIDHTHPDLAGKIWSNLGESANNRDDDVNGYINDVRGWDFVNDNADPADDDAAFTPRATLVWLAERLLPTESPQHVPTGWLRSGARVQRGVNDNTHSPPAFGRPRIFNKGR